MIYRRESDESRKSRVTSRSSRPFTASRARRGSSTRVRLFLGPFDVDDMYPPTPFPSLPFPLCLPSLSLSFPPLLLYNLTYTLDGGRERP